MASSRNLRRSLQEWKAYVIILTAVECTYSNELQLVNMFTYYYCLFICVYTFCEMQVLNQYEDEGNMDMNKDAVSYNMHVLYKPLCMVHAWCH